MTRQLFLASLLVLLGAAPGAATDLSNCHLRQLKAVAGVANAGLKCWSRQVARRDQQPDTAGATACVARAFHKYERRYFRAGKRLARRNVDCVLPRDGLSHRPAVEAFVESATNFVLENSDPLDREENRARAKALKLVGKLARQSLTARGKNAQSPDRNALGGERAVARLRFEASTAKLAAPIDVDALIAEVDTVEASVDDTEWYQFTGIATWENCFDPAYDGDHPFAGTTTLTTTPDTFAGVYEAWSGSAQSIGLIENGTGPLSAGSFEVPYRDFVGGTSIGSGRLDCTLDARPGTVDHYDVACVGGDRGFFVFCSVKDATATLTR